MESDDDATYTHFAHKEAFFSLFDKFLKCRLDEAEVGQEQSDSEERLVESIGAIVGWSQDQLLLIAYTALCPARPLSATSHVT